MTLQLLENILEDTIAVLGELHDLLRKPHDLTPVIEGFLLHRGRRRRLAPIPSSQRIPLVENSVIERMWVRDRWQGEAATISADEISLYVGDYGERHLVVHEGKLSYYRGSGTPRELVPVAEHQFMMRSLDFFKIEIELGADGRAEKIVGYYSDGSRDESPRDG